MGSFSNSAMEKNKAVKENIGLAESVPSLYGSQGKPSWEDII